MFFNGLFHNRMVPFWHRRVNGFGHIMAIPRSIRYNPAEHFLPSLRDFGHCIHAQVLPDLLGFGLIPT
jgi:hypothetical protein